MDDLYTIQGRQDAGFINVGKHAEDLRRHAANAPPYSERANVDLQFLLVAAIAVAVVAYYRGK